MHNEKKKEIWPSPMTKPPIPTENSKTKGQHTQTPPKINIWKASDNTTGRTDLGNDICHPTRGIYRFTGTHIRTPQTEYLS